MSTFSQIDDDLPLEYLSEMRQVSVLFINLVFENLGDGGKQRDTGELRSLQAAFNAIYDTAHEFKGLSFAAVLLLSIAVIFFKM